MLLLLGSALLRAEHRQVSMVSGQQVCMRILHSGVVDRMKLTSNQLWNLSVRWFLELLVGGASLL